MTPRLVMLLVWMATLAVVASPRVAAYSHLAVALNGRTTSVSWEQPRVRWFALSTAVPGVSLQQLQSTLERAFGTWEAVPTASIAFQFGGFTSAAPFDDDSLSVLGFQDHPERERVLGATTFVVDRFTGELLVSDGQLLTGRSPKQIIDAGLGFVPEDRKHDGFVGLFTVAENLVLNQFDAAPYARGVALNLAKITANAQHRMVEFDIRAESIETPVSSLSGGNQQEVVLARELSRPLSAMIANQPTRGVDVGAIEFLHQRLVAERDNGTAVLIVSTELDEVVALADRIAVMYRGRIVGIVPADTRARCSV